MTTSKRHALFVACHEASEDVWLSELFLAFAYGVYPMAVHEDAAAEHLIFRRTGGASEKDKVTRLQKAAQELAACPEVEAFNKKNIPLFIHASSITVSWPLDMAVPIITHVSIIACLLRWTRMDRFDGIDGPWGTLHRRLRPKTPAPPLVQSRTVRTAMILEFVGTQAQEEGLSDEKCLRRVQQALEALNNGKLRIDSGPDGAIQSVHITPPTTTTAAAVSEQGQP